MSLGSSILPPLTSWLGNAQVVILCILVLVIAAISTLFSTDDIFESETGLDDRKKFNRTSPEAHLLSLQEGESSCSQNMPKTTSVPKFLDLE